MDGVKRYVLGDVHGNYKGLKQALERSGFNYENDTLISLGDVVDGFSQSFECVEELLKIKNLIAIRGNHDVVFQYWMEKGHHMFDWSQGAQNTAKSYAEAVGKDVNITATWRNPRQKSFKTDLLPNDIPQSHVDFFKSQLDFHIDEKNRGFVHAGFIHPQGLGYCEIDNYHWDRELWQYYSLEVEKGGTNFQCFAHEEVFIGHTPVLIINKTIPITRGRVTNMDTGGGYSEGRVSIMNIDTHEFWQSDLGAELYPNEKPRG